MTAGSDHESLRLFFAPGSLTAPQNAAEGIGGEPRHTEGASAAERDDLTAREAIPRAQFRCHDSEFLHVVFCIT